MTEPTRVAVKQHVFDGTTWARLNVLLDSVPPVLEIKVIDTTGTHEICGLKVRSVPVEHPVPTIGVIIEDEQGSVAISSDTGPTTAFWDACQEARHLHALFLECSLPNDRESQALHWGHLTPRLLALELAKLDRPVRTYAVHLKASCHDRIARELAELNLPHVEIVTPGKTYQFPDH